MIAPDSSVCYLEIDNSVFLGEVHWDYYLQRFSFPDLNATGSIRIANYLARRSFSSDGRWIIIVQGESDHEQIVVFDAAPMKPVDWPKS